MRLQLTWIPHWGAALCGAPVATGRGAGVDLLGAMLTYDTEDCLARLDPGTAPLHEILCSNAADTSVERFNDILAGVLLNPSDTPGVPCRSGDSIISAPEGADPEIPVVIKLVKLQHDVSARFDKYGHDRLLAHFGAQIRSECDVQRFTDVRQNRFIQVAPDC